MLMHLQVLSNCRPQLYVGANAYDLPEVALGNTTNTTGGWHMCVGGGGEEEEEEVGGGGEGNARWPCGVKMFTSPTPQVGGGWG
jgi:hypothetical protein